jgi:diaminohydroxyphosphoribosylaminopyrimidine deaminase/5-amino-6-(5-phosphoribosylamino)uracil reductase
LNQENFDFIFMAQAMKLAQKSSLTCRPNPAVGAVIVKNNEVIADGYHERYGSDHAEVMAIKKCKDASQLNQSTIYITMEPCSHQGKTPPCVDLILASNISRVVIASLDPNPKVHGQGVKKLLDANIKVDTGILENQAFELNRGFFSRMQHQKPYVISKIAASVDGKTALRNWQSKWISGAESRANVQQLRKQCDGILTSYKTINVDNPQLNIREVGIIHQPYRFILDTNLKLNMQSQILQQSKVIVYHAEPLKSKPTVKAEFVQISKKDHQLNLQEIMAHMCSLEVNDLLVESGANLNGVLIQEKWLDELVIFQANSILGGEAKSMFNFPVIDEMQHRIQLEMVEQRYFGTDRRLKFKVNYVD